MQWFRKLFPRRDAKSKSLISIMKWFKKSTVDHTLSQSCSPLKNEIDVVPKTEFSASRQTLNNINIALKVGESSGEPTLKNQHVEDSKKKCCENKHCCGAFIQDSQDDLADCGDDESIKNYKNSKSTLIDILRRADNNAHASKGSSPDAINETDCRRENVVMKAIENGDYIIYFAPNSVDYERIEVPDSLYPTLIEYSSVR